MCRREVNLTSCTLSQCTPQQEIEFWDSITPSSPEYHYAVLKKAIIYGKKLKNIEEARKLVSSIPEEEQMYLKNEYDYDFTDVEFLKEIE